MVVPDEVWNFLIRQHLQQLEGPMSDCVHSVNKLMVEAFEEVEKVKFIFFMFLFIFLLAWQISKKIKFVKDDFCLMN